MDRFRYTGVQVIHYILGLTFSAVVKNQGAAATPSNSYIDVNFFVDGSYKRFGSVNGALAAGASLTVKTGTGTYVIPSGNHTLSGIVNPSNVFVESSTN